MITLQPIGHVKSERAAPVDDGWDAVAASIVLDPDRFEPEALAGLEQFSHVEVIFHFHLAGEDRIEWAARHPRGRTDWPKVGIFAQRNKDRPNRLGATVCRVLGVDGRELRLAGLDAIDGTPVLDIKPVMRGYLPRGDLVEPAWAGELMAGYWGG